MRPTAVEVFDKTPCQTVSILEAAAILGVSEAHLHELAREHDYIVPGLPVLKIGAKRRVPRAKLLAYAAGDWTPEAPE